MQISLQVFKMEEEFLFCFKKTLQLLQADKDIFSSYLSNISRINVEFK